MARRTLENGANTCTLKKSACYDYASRRHGKPSEWQKLPWFGSIVS